MTTIFAIFQSANKVVETKVKRFIDGLPIDPKFPPIVTAQIAPNIYSFVAPQKHIGIVIYFLEESGLHGHYIELAGEPTMRAF